LVGNPEEGGDHLEELGVVGGIILKRMLNWMGWYGVYWIHLAQDRDQCRALANVVTNLRVPLKKLEYVEELKNKVYSFQDGICSMKLEG
jgi:hypothetical protein